MVKQGMEGRHTEQANGSSRRQEKEDRQQRWTDTLAELCLDP